VGHVAVVTDVADALELDRVLWIPAGRPPHKEGEPLSDPELRLEMTRAAAAGDPRFAVSDMEIRRAGPSYTVDTLRALRREHPGAQLYLVLGADQIRTLETGWKEPLEVLRIATLALMDREGEAAPDVAPDLPGMERAVHVPVTRVDVSSTRVREAAAGGLDLSELVPSGVAEVIRREGLYGA
jgi:nicotinate-nucleotide adenylyltransferase